MPSRKRADPARVRVGRVSIYQHHGAWWLYYRANGAAVRHKVAPSRQQAEQIAAQVNAQLATGAPTLLTFIPISISDLRQEFLAYHECVVKSSIATVSRYRAATQHLVNFAAAMLKSTQAHEISPDAFATFLRTIDVSPNGHPHSARRRLRDKGIQFILETCRALYAFAIKRRHLPPFSRS